MMNIIRADMYRIFRGKAIYITFAIMLLIAVLSVIVFMEAPQTGIIIEVTIADDAADAITGATAAQMAISSIDLLVYFFLPLILIVAISMFSSGAIKNEISTGLDRTKLYFSKFILSSTLSIVFMLLHVLLHIILATPINGFGYWGGILSNMVASFGALILVALAFNSIGIFLCFVFQRSGAVNGIYLAVVFVPSAIIMLLSMAWPSVMDLISYDLFNQFPILSNVNLLSNAELACSIAICLVFILAPLAAGVTIFKKAEIK